MRTKNFTLFEVIHSDYAEFPKELLPVAYMVMGKLQVLRDFCGVSIVITSGYRSETYNKEIGGAFGSRHIWRLDDDAEIVWAVDIYSPSMTPEALYEAAKKLFKGEVYLHKTKKFVHISNSMPLKEPWTVG